MHDILPHPEGFGHEGGAWPTKRWHPRGRDSRREAGDYQTENVPAPPRRRWSVYSITTDDKPLVDSILMQKCRWPDGKSWN